MGVSSGCAGSDFADHHAEGGLEDRADGRGHARFTMISTLGSVATLIVQPPLVAQAGSEPMVMIFLALAAAPTRRS
jgi:hypothetical protein